MNPSEILSRRPRYPSRPAAVVRRRRSTRRTPVLDRLEDRTFLTATLDPSFGVGGKATVPFELANAGAQAAALQPDGRVVVAGHFGPRGVGATDFLVARYNADGTLDPTFSGDGIATIAFDLGGGNYDQAAGVALQADGRIVVVGTVQTATDTDFGIARLNPDGTPDTSFDGDGKATIAFNAGGTNNDNAADVAIDSVGRIVIVGTVDTAAGADFGIARLNPDGSPDATFSGDGRSVIPFNLGPPGSRRDDARAVAIRADNRIVVAGTAEVSATDQDFALLRLNPDGSPDATFGTIGLPGRQTVAFNLGGNGRDKANDVAVRPDGTIVVAGTVERAGGDRDFGVARLLPSGALDPTFGTAGLRAIGSPVVPGTNDTCNALALQGDGAVVLVGQVQSTTGGVDFGVARLTPAGDLDTGFDGDGWQTVGFNLGGSNLDSAQAVVVQPDGRIVAVGEAFEDFVAIMLDPVALARFNPDGSIDTTYGNLGRVARPFGFADGVAAGMAIQPDGRAVVAGTVTRGGNLDFAVARVNPDGTLDPSFGGTGVVVIPFDVGGTNADRANAVTLQADGRIVVVGAVDTGASIDMGIVRLNPDGTLDPTFGLGGRRILGFDAFAAPSRDEADAVAVQGTGEIVVAGTVDNALGVDFAVARLNPDGSVDGTFDAGGFSPGRRIISFNLGGGEADHCRDLAIQPDGRILLAGDVERGGGNIDYGLARLNPDGTLDTTFDGDGRAVVPFDLGGGNVDRARALALQPDGRIVVVGSVTTAAPGDSDFGVARLNPDGTLDPTFSGDGRQTVAFNLGGNNVDRAADVAVQGGRIVVVGAAERDAAGDNDFAVARLREDGTLDGSFAPDGRRTVAFNLGGGNADAALAVAALDGSRLLLAGTSSTDTPPGGPIVTMARLTISPPPAGDYDGDGQTDLALYHYDAAAGNAVFDLRLSNNGTPMDVTRTITGVGPHVVPVAGDYDGDGRADIAVVDPLAIIGGGTAPNATVWIILLSSQGDARREVPFGGAGTLDRPAPADYDGDGVTDIATYRADSDITPGAAQWFILPSIPNPGGFATRDGAFPVVFGAPGGTDLPAPADYDGDGRADIATFRPVSDLHPGAADWFILPSAPNVPNYATTTGGRNVTFGAAGNADQPAVADYNDDGRDDITAFRSESDLVAGAAQWFVLPSAGGWPGFGGGFSVTFGAAGAIAAVGDYNRDGRPDLALFDATAGTWALRDGTGGAALPPLTFGPTGPGVVPVLAPLYFRLRATGNI